MPDWEYSKTDLNGLPRKTNDIDLLNDLGQDGWELVNITANNIAYLKRQISASAPAKAARRTKAPAV
jgi:hypothetical protein